MKDLRILSIVSGAGLSVLGVLDDGLYISYKKHKKYLDNKYGDFKQIITSINYSGSEVF